MSLPLTLSSSAAARALNLSYVLHAPSDSQQVSLWLRRQTAAVRQLERAAPRLSRLDDGELRRRIVLAPGAASHQIEPSQPIISLRLGLWELLPRALGLTFGARPAVVTLLDDDAPGLSLVDFFRAPARLNFPPPDAFPARLATLILRPGGRSLLLEDLPVTSPHELTGRAEDAARRFVDQWRCARALWPV
ncbi:MAG TPA: hypothetical protein VFI42_06450, partial [Thermomicrobiaceae bacterium]|nr:hypothetical protein [Thermomicrobiaceae bacterium]